MSFIKQIYSKHCIVFNTLPFLDDEKADIARYFSRKIQMGETINKQQEHENILSL